MRKVCKFVILVAMCGGAIHANPIFALNPDETLTGAPGATVGWGLSITDSDEFVIVSETAFCLSATHESDLGNCANQVQDLGVYTDFSAVNFFVVGPPPESETITQAFDLLAQTGYGSFVIDSSVPSGTVTNGVLAIIYQLYSGDPLNGGSQIGGDNFTALPASVTVSSEVTPPPDVPEPGTLFPIGVVFAGAMLMRKKLAM